MFKEIDTDGSGSIDYGEFVTAAINKQTMLTQSNIDMMFKLYDKDGNGEIDRAELKQFLFDQRMLHSEVFWKR